MTDELWGNTKVPFFRCGLRKDNSFYLESKRKICLSYLRVIAANHWFVFYFRAVSQSFIAATVRYFKPTHSGKLA